METKVPFNEYHLRIYRAPHQLSIQTFDFLHKTKIKRLALSPTQKHFFLSLLELPGVLRYSIRMNEIVIYKWPGYEWGAIEPAIIEHIQTCTIAPEDLAEETRLVVAKWKNKNH